MSYLTYKEVAENFVYLIDGIHRGSSAMTASVAKGVYAVCYSYGEVIATWTKEGGFLVTSQKFSSTTSKHTNEVSYLLEQGDIEFKTADEKMFPAGTRPAHD